MTPATHMPDVVRAIVRAVPIDMMTIDSPTDPADVTPEIGMNTLP